MPANRFPGQWFQFESGLHQNWMRDYDPTTGRYLQADPLGLVDGASVYGYAAQSPGRWVDPRGEEVAVPGPFGSGGPIIGVAPGTPLGDALSDSAGDAFGALLELSSKYNPIDLAFQWVSGPSESSEEGGNAKGQSPYDKTDEQDAIDFVPDPFGGDDYCRRLKWAINVLRARSAWRISDLNKYSESYRGHVTRIAILTAALNRLEEHYRNVCGGECPWE